MLDYQPAVFEILQKAVPEVGGLPGAGGHANEGALAFLPAADHLRLCPRADAAIEQASPQALRKACHSPGEKCRGQDPGPDAAQVKDALLDTQKRRKPWHPAVTASSAPLGFHCRSIISTLCPPCVSGRPSRRRSTSLVASLSGSPSLVF